MRLSSAISVLFIISTAVLADAYCWQYDPKIESPCNSIIANATGYTLRRYAGANLEFFTVAQAQSADFSTAEQEGFQTNFAYISGGNSQSAKIPMTAPVFMRTTDFFNWKIGFYVPASIYPNETSIPTSPSIAIEQFGEAPPTGLVMAVYEFPGYASLSDFQTGEATLKASLAQANITVVADDWAVVYAQYDSPFSIFNRHNEVLIHVSM